MKRKSHICRENRRWKVYHDTGTIICYDLKAALAWAKIAWKYHQRNA